MKTLITKHPSIVALAFGLLAACGSSEGDPGLSPDSADNDSPLETRQLTVADATGESHVTLSLSSDDPGALAAYSESNFELIPITDGEPGSGEDDAASEDAVARAANPVSVEVIALDLAPGVVDYQLVDHLDPAYRAAFVSVNNDTSDDCVIVTRVSAFNEVRAEISTQASSGAPFVVRINETSLNRNDPFQSCFVGTYKVRARVERRNSNDYTFSHYN